MRRRLAELGLPLLARELSEQAARARHYAMRSVCASIIYVLGFLYLHDLLAEDGLAGFASLGNGAALFDRVYQLLLAGVLLFLPALTCGSIAAEKERNTLPVLLTTPLGAVTIVLEKLLGRLIPAFALLLLAVPLLSVAYALGGLTFEDIAQKIHLLAALSVLVATLSLACSAWCGSTVSAFFMSYAIGLALLITSGLFHPISVLTRLQGTLAIHRMSQTAIVLVILSLGFFLLAVRCLLRRAFVAPRNFLLGLFHGLDAFYERRNRLFGNIVLTREGTTLPEDRPVAWRETAKKSLATVRYLVRIVVAIEFPTLFLLVTVSQTGSASAQTGVATGLWVAVWCVDAALIAVTCGSLISGERSRQTLPVLLATPIPGDQMVDQLFAGVHRLIRVLWIPQATIALFEYWFYLNMRMPEETVSHDRLICNVCQMIVFPYLVAWTTFYVGAKIRSPLWAIVASLLLVAGAVIAPDLSQWLLSRSGIGGHDWLSYTFVASPATIIVLNERRRMTLAMTATNFLVYGLVVFLIRGACRQRADQLLGRAEMISAPPSRSASSVMGGEVATA